MLEARIKFHANLQIAVLARVSWTDIGAGLDNVLGEGDFHQCVSRVDLHIGASGWTTGAEQGEPHNPDMLRGRAGRVRDDSRANRGCGTENSENLKKLHVASFGVIRG